MNTTPKDNLQLVFGNYELEPCKNVIEYEPVNKDITEEILDEFSQSLFGNLSSNGTEQVKWSIKEKGEKPAFQTGVKLTKRGTLQFESNIINLFSMENGKIKLGHNNKDLMVAFSQGYGYVSKIFIDLNFDGKIIPEEEFNTQKVSRETVYQKDNNGFEFVDYYVYNSRIDNIPVMVSYLKSNQETINKELHISLYIKRLQKPFSLESTINELSYEVKDYFSGICSITDKGQIKNVKLIIIDKNNNGLFNDFNIDSILVKLNQNDLTEYRLKKSYQNGSSKKTIVHLFSYPKCIIIAKNNDKQPKAEELEP